MSYKIYLAINKFHGICWTDQCCEHQARHYKLFEVECIDE